MTTETVFGMPHGHTVMPDARVIMEPLESGGSGGGTTHYEGLTPDDADKLLAMGAVWPDDSQNYSPSFSEFVELAHEFGLTLHGYRVVETRGDERITCEGLSGRITDSQIRGVVMSALRQADEFTIDDDNSFRSWWD